MTLQRMARGCVGCALHTAGLSTRGILFSLLVGLMLQSVCRAQASVHAAYRHGAIAANAPQDDARPEKASSPANLIKRSIPCLNRQVARRIQISGGVTALKGLVQPELDQEFQPQVISGTIFSVIISPPALVQFACRAITTSTQPVRTRPAITS